MEFKVIMESVFNTLGMCFISVFMAYLVGLPVGVILHITSKNGLRPNRIINFVLGLLVNILRSIPCLIVVVICLPLTRLVFGTGTGEWYTILIPLFIASFGFVARLVEQSLQEVPSGEIEAIKSLGASDLQIVYKVLLPEAKVSLITGVSVAAVTILGYTSFAYNIAAGGLISDIWLIYAQNTSDYSSHFEFWLLIIIVIVLVQITQETGLYIAKKIDKRRRIG